MHAFFKATALVAASASIATAVPASAAMQSHAAQPAPVAVSAFELNQADTQSYGRDRHRYSREDRRRGYGRTDYRGYDEPRRVWRGNNGRYYCEKKDGTTGLLIGGAAGALLGREIDGGRDRTVGTLIGAAAGALLGREVDRGGQRCR
ncbi:MAG: glycine zipper 2TM domain-containing protein [Pseudomonadota bacterium]|nr:glycine zipper 2TM domain-containing protein [Pseudomonadota bacterium]